uniref:Protein disulfide-isomerase n=1 Tax=Albugo laibachii Nc14 TaxID=890382 RepID=F0WYU0_9STRA|nr:protein disulfideisomerase putative [Albugo laibachii Nc14]|eukprot:CCA26649.1 protein disulfideisomerase putative [Albugo laibachii Nc14]
MFLSKTLKLLAVLTAVSTPSVALDSSLILEEIDYDDNVMILTDENFDQVIEEVDAILVKFYSPSCGHCVRMAPAYAEAAKTLVEEDTEDQVYLAKVDATVHKKLAERFKVQGFPTLKFFKKDQEPVEFDGGRQTDEILKWIKKRMGPAVHFISTKDELTDLQDANDVVVYAVIDEENGEQRDVLEKLAIASDDVVFVASIASDISEHATKPKSIVILRKFDEPFIIFDGEFTDEAIKAFVAKYKLPLIVTFSQESAGSIFGGGITQHLMMFADPEQSYHEDIKRALEESASKFRGQVLHVVVPVSEDRILEYFGLKKDDLPSAVLIEMSSGLKKFKFDYNGEKLIEKVTSSFASDLINLVELFLEGEAKPWLKSAEPTDDTEMNVKVIVAKQFMERVIESDKDVLLEFYAPWCGHCNQLAPVYRKLADMFADVDSIMIAKIDATENEIDFEKAQVSGFPTIFFFPANDKMNPVLYEGGRDVESMAEYLKEHAKKFELEGESFGADHDEL